MPVFPLRAQKRRKVQFEPTEDRMFDPVQFDLLQKAMGRRFTLEAACNDCGDNALIPDNYCSPADSFFDRPLAGQFIFMNGPFSQYAEWLDHYCQEKAKDPYSISACIVAPAWKGAVFNKYFKGMSLVKQYPKGTRLFWAKDAQTGERKLMPGIPWTVNVWYDPPKIRPRPRITVLQDDSAVTGEAVVNQQSTTRQGNEQLLPYLSMQTWGDFMGQKVKVLFDTGATGRGFISHQLLQKLGLEPQPCSHEVAAFDGHSLEAVGTVTGRLKLMGLREKATLMAVKLDDCFDIILGDQWLQEHLCDLSYREGRITVECVGRRYSIPAQPREHEGSGDARASRVAAAAHWTGPASPKEFLTAVQIRRLVKRNHKMYLVHIREILEGQGAQSVQPDSESAPVENWYAEQPQSSPMLAGDSPVDRVKLDRLLQEYADVLRDLPAGLPPERPVHHSIPLVPGAQPVHRRCYRMSPAEREVVQEYVEKLLKNGWVVPSTSPWGAPILLVPKPDGTMRVCVDYRALNALTIKNKFALPRVDDLIDSLSGAKVFSALDLASGYWQIRLSPEDAEKTGFNTHEGHYEWKVLPMGLSNAPATFQHMMNSIFAGKGLHKFVAVYLDDILIYSKTPEEHLDHLRQVFQVLREQQFYCKLSKCHFAKTELKYLGHIVGVDGIKVDPAKIKKVAEWPTPKSSAEVRSFLGLATYFRRFIQGFSSIARPLHRLTQHDMAHVQPFPWTATCQAAFETLKLALTTAPVLKMPDYEKSFEIVCDASLHGIGAVLLQDGHPIAYESKKFTPAEYRYDTGEQEMLGVVHGLKTFRCYVAGRRFTLVTDHEPLTYFNTQPQLSRKHARWYEFLQTFDFGWVHRPGRINVADPLSRLPAITNSLDGLRVTAVHRHVLCATTRAAAQPKPVATVDEDPLLRRIKAAYSADEWFQDPDNIANHHLTQERELWWRGQAVVVPDADNLRLQCLHAVHDSAVGGHFGIKKTRELAQRLYWWPGMRKQIDTYVRECVTCQRNKSPNHAPFGELQPLPIPDELWEQISFDLIVKLPKTKRGHDSILVVVDRLSKYTIFTPCTEKLDSPGLVSLLESKVVADKGYPKMIISDRDVRATAKYYQDWCSKHDIKPRESTAYHSQANGQAERTNLTSVEELSQVLCQFQSG